MATANHIHSGDSSFDVFFRELNLLEQHYGTAISRGMLPQEIQTLRLSLEESMQGSPEAANYLQEYGNDLLEAIRMKLELFSAQQNLFNPRFANCNAANGDNFLKTSVK